MPEEHEFAAQFIAHMSATQQAYAQRRIDDYLAGFSEDYYSVQLHSKWGEDKSQLAAKIARDMQSFELLQMDFEVLRAWYAGETGFALLGYHSRLKSAASGRVLVDRRENIIVGQHLGGGRWTLTGKIVVKAENYYE